MNVSPSERVCVCVRFWISFWILQIRIHGECLLTAYFWTWLEMKKKTRKTTKNVSQTLFTRFELHILPVFLWKKLQKKTLLGIPGEKVSCQQMLCIHRCVTTCAIEKVRLWLGAAPHHHTYICIFPFPNTAPPRPFWLRWNLLAFSFELSFFWCV